MTKSRRELMTALGVAGVALASSGRVFATNGSDDRLSTVPATDLDDGRAAIRVAHFSPDAPDVDVFVDGEQAVSDLPYDDVSPYISLEPGAHTVRITPAGDPKTVAFEDELTFDEAFYTVAGVGELEAETFEPLVLVDAGTALVRFVHASPDAPAVDVFAQGRQRPLFSDLSFGEETEYLPLPVGSYTLEVVPTGDGPVGDEVDETDETSEPDEADEAEPPDEDPDTDEDGDPDAPPDEDPDDIDEDAEEPTPSDEDAEESPPDDSDEDEPEEVPDELPDDIDEDELPDDVPDDIDEGDIPDDIDEEDIPDGFDPDDLSTRVSSTAERSQTPISLAHVQDDASSLGSLEIDLERGQAYTGYAIGYLQSGGEMDRELRVSVTVDGDTDDAGSTVEASPETY